MKIRTHKREREREREGEGSATCHSRVEASKRREFGVSKKSYQGLGQPAFRLRRRTPTVSYPSPLVRISRRLFARHARTRPERDREGERDCF